MWSCKFQKEIRKFQGCRGNDRQKTRDDIRHVVEPKHHCRGGKETSTQ